MSRLTEMPTSLPNETLDRDETETERPAAGSQKAVRSRPGPPLRPKSVLVVLSLSWIVLCVFVAIFADVLAPYELTAMDLRNRLQPPVLFGGSWAHPLGTDELGRDIFSRFLVSVRVSIFVALVGTLIGAVLGTAIGFLAAHFRGWVDDLVMMLIDSQAALPFMIVALMVIAFFGSSLTLFIVIVGIYGWERYARLARGMALSALERGYVSAVRSFGSGPVWLYWRHILPNVASALIVNATLNFPQTILLESSLSFLGLGIQPPMTSLGNMLGYGREYLLTAWWMAVIPGVAISLTALAVSILGDDLRDRIDPMLTDKRAA
ncbi:MAG: ABC transporter permease [Kiloniellales bacterium]|nr:ABC transporter permease [Kiloniellales bacterium]